MKIEQQVCSLELAKKLKELGFTQKSMFHWMVNFETETEVLVYETMTGYYMTTGAGYNTKLFTALDVYSAFTVAELGEMLPSGIHSFKANTFHFLNKKNEKWWCDFTPGGKPSKGLYEGNCFANTEADARAKMLIYLFESKLVTIPNA